mmetsp:Transcript_11174/g.36781  ORF Transcript_11174/g.36781 Transcript_11174/m.36781 type:complete len:285 (-) Transcript_11174:41-895(-)
MLSLQDGRAEAVGERLIGEVGLRVEKEREEERRRGGAARGHLLHLCVRAQDLEEELDAAHLRCAGRLGATMMTNGAPNRCVRNLATYSFSFLVFAPNCASTAATCALLSGTRRARRHSRSWARCWRNTARRNEMWYAVATPPDFISLPNARRRASSFAAKLASSVATGRLNMKSLVRRALLEVEVAEMGGFGELRAKRVGERRLLRRELHRVRGRRRLLDREVGRGAALKREAAVLQPVRAQRAPPPLERGSDRRLALQSFAAGSSSPKASTALRSPERTNDVK